MSQGVSQVKLGLSPLCRDFFEVREAGRKEVVEEEEEEEGYTALPHPLPPSPPLPSVSLAHSHRHTLKSHTPGNFTRRRDARSCLSRIDNKRGVSRLELEEEVVARRRGGNNTSSSSTHSADKASFSPTGRVGGGGHRKRRNPGPSAQSVCRHLDVHLGMFL